MRNTQSAVAGTLTALALIGTLTACASGSDTAAPAGSAGGSGAAVSFEAKSPCKLGYSVYDLSDPYFISYLAGIKSEAQKNNCDVIVADQKSNQQEQVNGSSNLINQGISGLIISPIQPDALPVTIEAAHAAKIPVVVGDVGATGDYDFYTQSDNATGGQQAADFMIKKLKDVQGDKEVAIIGLPPEVGAGQQRSSGFKEGIKADPSITVVGEVVGQSIDNAYKSAQDLLAAHPNLKAIFANNSNNVQGAIRAAETAGRTDLLILGFNGDPVEMDLISQGKEAATVAQDPFGQGVACVKAVMSLLNGQTPDFTDPSTKTLEIATTLVDSSNVAEYKTKLAEQLASGG